MSMTPVALTRMDSSHCATVPLAPFIGRSTELFTSPWRMPKPVRDACLQAGDRLFVALIERLRKNPMTAHGFLVGHGAQLVRITGGDHERGSGLRDAHGRDRAQTGRRRP